MCARVDSAAFSSLIRNGLSLKVVGSLSNRLAALANTGMFPIDLVLTVRDYEAGNYFDFSEHARSRFRHLRYSAKTGR